MHVFLKALAALSTAVILTLSSHAQTTFTFADADQRQADGVDGSLNFLADTLSLNVTAFTFEDFDTALPFQTAEANDGLFVDTAGSVQGLRVDNDLFFDGSDSTSQIDGQFFNEIVIFTFSRTVNFIGANFDAVGSNDDFTFVGGAVFTPGAGVTGTGQFTADIPGGNGNIFTIDPLNELVGPSKSFGIAAIGDNDDFVIRSITVSAVPEPATWLMMIIGFAFIGLARKRRTHPNLV